MKNEEYIKLMDEMMFDLFNSVGIPKSFFDEQHIVYKIKNEFEKFYNENT